MVFVAHIQTTNQVMEQQVKVLQEEQEHHKLVQVEAIPQGQAVAEQLLLVELLL